MQGTGLWPREGRAHLRADLQGLKPWQTRRYFPEQLRAHSCGHFSSRKILALRLTCVSAQEAAWLRSPWRWQPCLAGTCGAGRVLGGSSSSSSSSSSRGRQRVPASLALLFVRGSRASELPAPLARAPARSRFPSALKFLKQLPFFYWRGSASPWAPAPGGVGRQLLEQ